MVQGIYLRLILEIGAGAMLSGDITNISRSPKCQQ